MTYADVVRDSANCNITLSHAGGSLPHLIGRPASMLSEAREEHIAFMTHARSFYLDTASCRVVKMC